MLVDAEIGQVHLTWALRHWADRILGTESDPGFVTVTQGFHPELVEAMRLCYLLLISWME